MVAKAFAPFDFAERYSIEALVACRLKNRISKYARLLSGAGHCTIGMGNAASKVDSFLHVDQLILLFLPPRLYRKVGLGEADFGTLARGRKALQSGGLPRYGSHDDSRASRSRSCQHELCGTRQPDDANEHAAFHAPDKCLLKEIRESLPYDRALHVLV